MWNRLLVLVLLVQWNSILSEPVNEKTENIRASRQLNFGDCCPCPGPDVFQDQESANTRIDSASLGDDSCPCRSTSDSESASSIISPVFRGVQSYNRPIPKKEEPKPLLNPEVGLASSVLETLREVTNQEYQEALARDAARSALKFIDPVLKNEPRNVVNIILSPNENNNDDIISEATENQDSSFIFPPLNMNNNFEHLRLQPPMELLKQILTPPKIISNGLNRNRFDMDGSTSNTQERILQPLKNNILENMKTRSNLLNLRPILNTESGDFLTSPNIFKKYYQKNNIVDRLLLRNRSLLDVQPKNHKLDENLAQNTSANNELDTKLDQGSHFKQNSAPLFDNTDRKFKVSAEDSILQNTDCTQTISEPKMFLEDNMEDFDVVPSSTSNIEVKNLNVIESPNVINQEEDTDINDAVFDADSDTINLDTLETVTERSISTKSAEVITEEYANDNKVDDETRDTVIENTTEHLDNIKDMESEPSMTRCIVRKLQDAANRDYTCTTEDESQIKNDFSMSSRDNVYLTSTEKNIVNSKIHTLPNIKADIFRTLENFKKANEQIQEKLRSNVQDALQLVVANKPHHSSTHSEQIQKLANDIPITQKNMSTQDLQKMSDSLLEQSSLKDNAETSTTSNCKEDLKEEFEKSAEVSDTDSMISSSNSLNVNNTLNLNKVVNITDDSFEQVCGEITTSKRSGSNSKINEDNEMAAQPSNSVFNSISHLDFDPSKLEFLQRDLITDPVNKLRPTEGIKDLFSDFGSLGTDTFSNVDSDSVFFTNQPLFEFNNDESIDSLKSFNRGFKPKFTSDSINSYKAKVASPKSLEIKSLGSPLPGSDYGADSLGFASQKVPHTTYFKNLVRNNVENEVNPLFKTVYTPRMLHDTFSSENFKSYTDNAFKTFRDSLDLAKRQPFTINKNNLLGKSLANPDNLFGAVLKTHEDFNEKLQAFHSDLSRRFSSISQRTPSENSRLLRTSSRLQNSKNRAEINKISNKNSGPKPVKTKSSTIKNTLLSKNKPESIKYKSTNTLPRSNIAHMLRSNTKHNLDILPIQPDSGSKKRPIAINPPKNYLNKLKPKNNINVKPLKENKVTISFASTTITPYILKSGLHKTDSLRSRSTEGSVKLPTLSKSLVDNKLILKSSKLKSNEPRVSASDISMSRAQLPNIERKSGITQRESFEESETSHGLNHNYGDRLYADVPEVNKRKALLLSKLKNAFATGISNDDLKKSNKVLTSKQNENVLDASQSASNNMDTSISATSLLGEPMKDNQSFKCKMVCIKDILEARDTYL